MKKLVVAVLLASFSVTLLPARPAAAKGRDAAMIIAGSLSVALPIAYLCKVLFGGESAPVKETPPLPPAEKTEEPAAEKSGAETGPADPGAKDPFNDWHRELAMTRLPISSAAESPAAEAAHE